MSVTFDDGVVKAMSDFLMAANRVKHVESRGAPSGDPTLLRRLTADETRAEQALSAELEARGWISPFRMRTLRGA